MRKFREQPLNQIPHGVYCYSYSPEDKMLVACPHWSLDPNLPPQENGCCSFLKTNDQEINEGQGLSLLWDSCKMCDQNMERE